MKAIGGERLSFLLESAILAPSADNRHALRFHLDDQAVLVRHTLADADLRGYKRALFLMSLGAVAENLVVAAGRFGIGATARLAPAAEASDLVLRVDLLPGAADPDLLWQAIPLRHTNRKVWFRGSSLDTDERARIDGAVSRFPQCGLRWFGALAERRPILRLMWSAEAERFRNPVLHAELFSAIRFDVGWHRGCEVGLPPGALGVEPPLRGLFSLLRRWPVMRFANRFGVHRVLGWRSAYLPSRLAPDLGVLVVKKADSDSLFAAGRAFQRAWLTATRLGRVLQPLPAAALYAMDGAVEQGIPAGLHGNLVGGWKAQLGDAVPLMLFRMGRAEPLAVHADRPSVEAFLEASRQA
jgi:hypothetical protein